VAGVAVLDALGLDVLELRLERVDQRDDRRAGRHAAFVVLLELDEVEIVAAAGEVAARSRARCETEKIDRPGGIAKAFCEPVIMTSMPSSSFLIGSTLKELTVSTMEMTSGNSRSTAMMAGRSLMQPQEVSLWMRVTAS
jgi:hypothetical protein